MTDEKKSALARAISVDPEVLHGVPCFTGTRVPVQTLLDFLETGESIDAFLKVYPYIDRSQVLTFLELSKDVAVEQLSCVSS
jgi:uncharacterized protein (DUF433 family)